MKPYEYYDHLLGQIDDDLERRVFDALAQRMGTKLTRAELLLIVFGDSPDMVDGARDAHDRMIRKCIQNLRLKSFPIVSTSGEAGYELVDDERLMDQYIAEEMARVEHIKDKVDQMRKSRETAHSLRIWREGRLPPIQPSMF